MEFLKMLQAARTPFWDGLFSAVTYLGDETAFLVAVLVLLWCIDKKWGYRLFMIGMAGVALNQLLKAIFLIPRPWVADSAIKPVPTAIEAASGYSFPSGHTQNAASVFGAVALWLKKRGATILCVVLVLLTGFSRMYLGVHTPLDVGVSLAAGGATVLFFSFLYRRAEDNARIEAYISVALVALACVLLLYVSFRPVTGRNIAEFDAHGLKNAYTLLGTVFGFVAARAVDGRFLRYEVRAAWWAQALKVLVGTGLVLLVRMGLKEPLYALFNGHYMADFARYFLMAVTVGVLWPLTFKLWAKTARRNA